ncbi:hypothetical protein ACET3X_001913 [Alternaria dauci]|uniref:rRNA methyltransferase 1, mitochondrial n=1 Tax=Alternaria dauci TaxID=48095 RepID=A0ABR3UYN4_9PLEO
MVYSCLTGSLLLPSRQLVVPRTFLRYKSITAAIERGRHGGPDRSFKPRTRTGHHDEGDGPVKTRREIRFEKFGAPREDAGAVSKFRSSDRRVASQQGSDDRPRRQWTNDRRDTQRARVEERPRRQWTNDRRDAPRDGVEERPRQWTIDRRDTQTARVDERPSFRFPQARDSGDDRPQFTHKPGSKGARREGLGRESSGARPGTGGETKAQGTSSRGPESLPYTTAASEFIYGYNSVVAAIKANRRKFYRLYVHQRGESRTDRDDLFSQVKALQLFPILNRVGDEYLTAFDKASHGRPHNGVILEASPLPVPLITELTAVSMEDGSFNVTPDSSQSREEVLVNGKQSLFSYKSDGWRNPLVLFLDGVVDEGNLGAIARSAYVLGADAIVTATHHSAKWSHIAVKASAGAAEAIPIFQVKDASDFLKQSTSAGWCTYASDAVPPVLASNARPVEAPTDKVVYSFRQTRVRERLPADHSPVAEHPTILMLGAEGTGLSARLLNWARYKVGIPHRRESNELGVDSLNVSVAASILCYEMLHKPKAPEREPENVIF